MNDLQKFGFEDAPVRMGQTVYAAVIWEDDSEEPVEEWQVCGVAYMEDAWHAVDKDGELWRVGDWGCLLSRPEAEAFYTKKEKENAL